jgi:hypothetical protein
MGDFERLGLGRLAGGRLADGTTAACLYFATAGFWSSSAFDKQQSSGCGFTFCVVMGSWLNRIWVNPAGGM